MQLVTRTELGYYRHTSSSFDRKTLLLCDGRGVIVSTVRLETLGWHDGMMYETMAFEAVQKDGLWQSDFGAEVSHSHSNTPQEAHESMCDHIAATLTHTPEFYMLAMAVLRGDQTAALALADAVCASSSR